MEKRSKSKFNMSTIPIVAFLMALEIILTRFLSINAPIVRIGFGFIPVALTAIMYGPWWAGAAYAIGDIIGAILFPTSGAYFPGFTLTALLTGMTYGFFLHKKPVKWKTMLPATLIVCLGLNLCLDTFWLYIILNQGVWGLLPARIIKALLMIPIQLITVPFLWKRISPFVTNRLGL